MSDEDELLDRVRQALAHVPTLSQKRMFGSTGFLVRGHLCIGCRPDRIMCRIDPSQHDEAIARAGCRTVIMRGRPYRGYVHVDADVLRTRDALKHWIDLALSYNASLPDKAT